MNERPADTIEAWAPMGMALVALAAIAKAAANFQHLGPPAAEDGPWHVFMGAMVLQSGGIFCFAFINRRRIAKAAPILAAQIGLFATCVAMAYLIPGLY